MVVERVLMVVLDAPVDSLFLSNLFVDGTDRSKGDAILRSTASFRTSAYKSCRESQEAWSSCGQRFFQAVFVSRALSRAFEPFERLVRHPSASLRFQEEKERERLRKILVSFFSLRTKQREDRPLKARLRTSAFPRVDAKASQKKKGTFLRNVPRVVPVRKSAKKRGLEQVLAWNACSCCSCFPSS